MTTQQPTALDSRVMAQVDTFIVHKLVSKGDLQYVLQNLKSRIPQEISRRGNVLSPEDLIQIMILALQQILAGTELRLEFPGGTKLSTKIL